MGREESENPWVTGSAPRGEQYDLRFAKLASEGRDVHGEADLVTSLGMHRIFDAGCGTGRIAIELAKRGCAVVGADIDPLMLDEARRKAPAMRWIEADLVNLELNERFDAVLLAGNVMIFLVPGTERLVLRNLARHLVQGGLLIAGFSLQPEKLDLVTTDRLALDASLVLEDRWSTWDRQPFTNSSRYAVSVYRKSELE